jgi:Resolvase, N terminal domain
MKAARYARVSTHPGHSPEMQIAELREFCTRRGWEITGEYVDVGVSGAKERRPQLWSIAASAVWTLSCLLNFGSRSGLDRDATESLCLRCPIRLTVLYSLRFTRSNWEWIRGRSICGN